MYPYPLWICANLVRTVATPFTLAIRTWFHRVQNVQGKLWNSFSQCRSLPPQCLDCTSNSNICSKSREWIRRAWNSSYTGSALHHEAPNRNAIPVLHSLSKSRTRRRTSFCTQSCAPSVYFFPFPLCVALPVPYQSFGRQCSVGPLEGCWQSTRINLNLSANCPNQAANRWSASGEQLPNSVFNKKHVKIIQNPHLCCDFGTNSTKPCANSNSNAVTKAHPSVAAAPKTVSDARYPFCITWQSLTNPPSVGEDWLIQWWFILSKIKSRLLGASKTKPGNP